MAKTSSGTNIRVDTVIHSMVISHLKETCGKVGKFTEMAIVEKIEREQAVDKKNMMRQIADALRWAKRQKFILVEITDENIEEIAKKAYESPGSD